MPLPVEQSNRWWRTRHAPFVDVWPEICGMLESGSARDATVIFKDIQLRFPAQFASGQLRTLQRKISEWRRKTCVNDRYELWTLRLLQGKIEEGEYRHLFDSKITQQEVSFLLDQICYRSIRYRNRAVAVLAKLNGIPIPIIANILQVDLKTTHGYIQKFEAVGASKFVDFSRDVVKKANSQDYIDALFSILHEPPSLYEVNRTRWEMEDLQHVMARKGFSISLANIRQIIRNAGYKFRKARKVLTSTDPAYRQKLEEITRTLSGLTESQKFFSIDEFGPFAVKMQGGRALTAPGQERVVPQWQKSKGSLTLIGALELSTNQITHFYATRKNTVEMIKLTQILLDQYNDESLIYLSWDAASWHASKAIFAEVARLNEYGYRTLHHTPSIALVPLPASAQFLNVIESIFSGMARAIIHNSDYASVEDCKAAIDRYFVERNEFFVVHPKRAGDKIWGKERVPPVFSPSNNCKDPLYR